MGLEELNQEIYDRDFKRESERSVFEPGVADDPTKSAAFKAEGEWKSDAPSAAEIAYVRTNRKRKAAWVLGAIAALLLVGGAVLKIRAMLFSEESVTLTVSGPRLVKSGEQITIAAFVGNKNWSDLTNATLLVSFPESFRPEADSRMKISGRRLELPLANLPKRKDTRIPIEGVFFGSRGEDADFVVTLRYSPASVSGQYEKQATFGLQVATSVVALDLIAPLETGQDTDMEYVVEYGNDGDTAISNVRVKMDYPEGFTYVSSEPRPSDGDHTFVIGTLAPDARGRIAIRGRISGEKNDAKKVSASIGYLAGDGSFVSYSESERSTRIIASPLFISQTVNGSREVRANAGDKLSYVVRFRNDGDIGLRDVIVTVRIDSPLLDYRALAHQGGSFDAGKKQLVWKSSDVPVLGRLNPGQGGEVAFTIPILNPLPESASGGNFTIEAVARIDSPDVPTPIGSNKVIASNTTAVRVNSTVQFAARLVSDDAELPMSGPLPPIVGQETMFTVRLAVRNAYNDLTDGVVKAIFPTGVRYTGEMRPGNETVEWNERSNELTWKLGTIRPDRNGERVARIRIAVTPEPNMIDTDLKLVNSVTFTAKDAFTGEERRIVVSDRDFTFQTGLNLEVQPGQ